MTTSYYVSCRIFTCRVDVNDRGIIVDGAPIVARFRGQPFDNLRRWIRKFPPVRVAALR